MNGKSKTEFLVIGAGLPRTGTSSTKRALEEILSGRCYHMETVIKGGFKEIDHWNKALDDLAITDPEKKVLTDQDWIEFTEGRGFKAGVDFPISIFYKSVICSLFLTFLPQIISI